MNRTFAAAARPFIERARIPASDILPVIPHDAKLGENTTVDPSNLGKVPGFYKGDGTWVGLPGTWPVDGFTTKQRQKAAVWPTHNVGLRAAEFPGIDIDVDDEELRDGIEELLDMQLGDAPVRTREGAVRTLWVYRRAPGEEPIRKTRVAFSYKGRKQAVEVLGLGQQYLVAGTHPTGTEYGWREGKNLTMWGVDALTKVTAGEVRAFMDGVIDYLRGMGAVIGNVKAASETTNADGTAVTEFDAVVPREVAIGALRAVPNSPETMPNREDLVVVLSSFKAALGREAEDARGEALTWAVADGWCDDAYFDKVWDSLTHVRVGPDYLLKRARKAGWHGDAASDFAGLPIEEAEAAITAARAELDAEGAAIETAAKQLCFWPQSKAWVVLSTGEVLDNQALNMHPIGKSVAPVGLSGQKAAHARLCNSGLVRDVMGITYAPGKGQLIEWTSEGRRGLWFNRWHPAAITLPAQATDADVQPWLEHVTWLLPNDAERRVFLQWMAYVLTNPGNKVRFAPVVIGKQGLGKDMMLKPLHYGLGAHNVSEISPSVIMDKWLDWMEAQLVVVQEIMRFDKVELYDKIKAQITGTGADTVRIEKKYQPAYPLQNNAAFMFFTNHPDAFRIAPDDRRFYVLQCAPEEPKPRAHYDDLVAWYLKGGYGRVVRWLMNMDLSDFRPDAAPEWTDAKRNMLEASLSPYGQWVHAEIGEGGRWGHRDTMTANEVAAEVAVPHHVRGGANPRAVAEAFGVAGWFSFPQQLRLSDGRKVRIWVRDRTLYEAGGKAVRTRYEEESAPGQDFATAA